MTFTDHGIATCSCGVERRLYAPETRPDVRWCLPCVRRWMRPQINIPLFGVESDARRHISMKRREQNREHQKTYRNKVRLAGLCWKCKAPNANGRTACDKCRSAEVARVRAYRLAHR